VLAISAIALSLPTSALAAQMTIDASTTAPVGVALRGVRFSPIPGAQE
jgi:hypothetical protein